MTLYKYKAFSEKTLRIITNGELYFSPPKKLNDPLDSTLLESWVEELKQQLTSKYGDNLSVEEFVDPISGEKRPALDAVMNRLQNEGIFSLSKRPDEILMWSHYGDEHRGICIGFNEEKLKKLIDDERNFNKDRSLIDIRRVNYENTPPYEEFIDRIVRRNSQSATQVHPSSTLFTDLLIMVLTTKYTKWSYEEEYRILKHLSENNCYQGDIVQFPVDCITEVLVGARANEITVMAIEQLRNLEQLAHIRFYRMSFDNNSFHMKKETF